MQWNETFQIPVFPPPLMAQQPQVGQGFHIVET